MRYLVIMLVLCSCVGGQLDPRTQRALDVFECRAQAVAPYVGKACDAADLVRDIARGQADLITFLRVLGHTVDAIAEAQSTWEGCATPELHREPPF